MVNSVSLCFLIIVTYLGTSTSAVEGTTFLSATTAGEEVTIKDTLIIIAPSRTKPVDIPTVITTDYNEATSKQDKDKAVTMENLYPHVTPDILPMASFQPTGRYLRRNNVTGGTGNDKRGAETPTETATSTNTATASATRSQTSTKSATATKSAVATSSSTHTAFPTETSSSSSSATATSTATASPSASASHSAKSTETATSSSSATSSASATATATGSTTPTPSTSFSVTPTSHAAEMNAGIAGGFFGGVASASFLLLGAIIFFPGVIIAVSRFIRRRRNADAEPLLDNNNDKPSSSGSPNRTNGGYTTVATEDTSASAANLAAQARIGELQAEVDTYKAMIFATANSTSLSTTSTGSGSNVPSVVWDRREYLQKCAEMTNLVATALDECIADAFATGKGSNVLVFAVSMQRLWTLTSSLSMNVVQSKKDQLLGVSAGTSNEQKDSLAKSTLFNIYYRSVLETVFTDNTVWNNTCTDVINTWLDELLKYKVCSTASIETIRTEIGRCGLAKAIAINCKLSVWPTVTNSNLNWALENNNNYNTNASSSSSLLLSNTVLSLSTNELKSITKYIPYDGTVHQVFSLDGRSTTNGDNVYEIGPSLQNSLLSSGGNSSSSNSSATLGQEMDMLSLRKTCRTLVVPVGKQ